MTQENKLLKELYSLLHGSMTHNTDRIKKIANYLQNPQDNYPIIHIAGTNGKGSVCSLLASILQEAGLKVGLYTSPHIIEFNERIRINGAKISDKNINHFYYKIRDFAFSLEASFFEITTAMAFDYFADNNIDIAVIETGLGGRLDSTNIVKPIATIITTIDKDHCNLLGNTLKEIANEKAGIMKPNTHWFLQDNNPVIQNIFQNKAKELNAPAIKNNVEVEFLQITEDIKMEIMIDKHKMLAPIVGKHQIQNIKTATIVATFLSEKFPSIDRNNIINGIQNVISNTEFHFRIECISKKPLVVIDISHNPQSIAILCETIKSANIKSKWNIVFGAMKDKDIKSMLTNLQPICNKLTIIEAEIDRAASKNDILKIANELNFNNAEIAANIKTIASMIQASSMPTIICGSFYIMKEIIVSLSEIANN